ncbi:MAG: septation ring formation regulator EzrA [Alphaproteobacteria bacterium]|jgi:cell division protein FtsB|nr:MAG: septation ring formation regulator EzrA [Alphaproteobacteria bacterium]
MRFVQIINQKKFTLITVFLFLYVLINLLDGQRGLISYYEKQKIKQQLIEEEKALSIKLAMVEKKNMLLTDKMDLDYLEILYRQKFMFGKSNEHIYKSN